MGGTTAQDVTPVVVDRRAARAAALEKAQAVASKDGDTDPAEAKSALQEMVAAFSPAARASAGPRELLEKAEPLEVKAFFESTGLTRKELAAAAGVSTSVIATVQNPAGDRWSTKTFEAKRGMIAKWAKEHAKEIKARKDGEAAFAAARAKAEADRNAAREAREAKAAEARAAQTAKAKSASKPTSLASAKKGTAAPSKAPRQARQKATA